MDLQKLIIAIMRFRTKYGYTGIEIVDDMGDLFALKVTKGTTVSILKRLSTYQSILEFIIKDTE